MPDLAGMHSTLIPNPVDQVFLSPNNAQKRTRDHNLLYVGEISARKNVLALVRMMSELVRRGVDTHLNVVGSFVNDDYRKACLQAVDDMELSPFVSFHGSVSPRNWCH